MKYKFYDSPPEYQWDEEPPQSDFKQEIHFLSSYLEIHPSRIYISGDHPVGEDVIFIDDRYCGYLDYFFYLFMDCGEDDVWNFKSLKEKIKNN